MFDNAIDFERLKEDLIDYFGVAMNTFPIAIVDICDIEMASESELIEIADKNGFDINDYKYDIEN